MTRWRTLVPRLSGLVYRRPLQVAVVAIVIGALGATGLFRFSVNAGQSLLVGSASTAGSTYASFSQTFGSDPIVVVFTATNTAAPYIERNLERLGALEIDLAHDPRVASVLGPGTIAGSLRQAAVAEVNKVLTEYPYFIAETDYLEQINMGNTDQQALQQKVQSDITNAQQLLALYVVKAAGDAHTARQQYTSKTGDTIIDSREKSVDAAVAKDPVPPLWAEYLAGPGQSTNAAAAQQFFGRVASAYGDCDDTIASLLGIQPSCQVYFERALLDLPNCPTIASHQFCDPKPQWAAVLPPPQRGTTCPGGVTGVPCSYETITIRLKPQYAADHDAVVSLRDKINAELSHGIASDSYTQSLSATGLNNLKSLGALAPTECGGETAQQDAACVSTFHDRTFDHVIAGAPLLGLGVVSSMSQLLAILFPVALFVMLLILAGVFRVRGRVWPLVAAVAATVLTVGLALLTGTPITPAVLAGVPVLIGLGVDYAVQLIARFAEERRGGAATDAALRSVLENSARATLIAAAATLAALLALAVVSGIDWGPLVAVPLVAEFALVLCVGVVLAWLGGLFIALPLTVWSDRRRGIEAEPEQSPKPARAARAARRPAERTLAIADNWRGVLALASVLAVAGWIALHFVPVQTDPQALVSPSLAEFQDIETVQSETGYTNEVDVAVHGQVATGPTDSQTGNPSDVEWQCGVASLVRSEHSDVVATATSIGDYLIASGSGPSGSAAAQCVPLGSGQPAPSPSTSPSATATPGSASPSPAASASPTALRGGARGAVTAAEIVPLADAASSPSPSATASPSASANASAVPSPVPTSSASPAPAGAAPPTQTPFLCDLRLLPLLSRTLVMSIGPDTQACPAVDKYRDVFLSKDSTPINPDSARIVIGVHTTSVADQARLVDQLGADIATPPNGMTAAPTGLAVLATTAYDNLVNRSYLLNLAPLAVVAAALFALYREPRRALLPLLPTALAAGWAPLLLLLLGRLPGGLGATLGSLNPLTVVLGALVIALGTEFGVMLLSRFYEERRRGLDPDAAAAAALGGAGRAIRVSALTLGAGFAVLALSGLFPNSFPLVADFGLAVVIDLALAVGAVFLVMLPLAVALERRAPLALREAASAPAAALSAPLPEPAPEPPPRRRGTRARRETAPAAEPAADAVAAEPVAPAKEEPAPDEPARSRRTPGVSGRRRPAPAQPPQEEPGSDTDQKRRPGVSGRRRRNRP